MSQVTCHIIGTMSYVICDAPCTMHSTQHVVHVHGQFPNVQLGKMDPDSRTSSRACKRYVEVGGSPEFWVSDCRFETSSVENVETGCSDCLVCMRSRSRRGEAPCWGRTSLLRMNRSIPRVGQQSFQLPTFRSSLASKKNT